MFNKTISIPVLPNLSQQAMNFYHTKLLVFYHPI
jgi:hypothetical protein